MYKILEKFLHNELYPLLRNKINQNQYGFVKRRSALTNLFCFSSYLFNNMDKFKQVNAVYTDFKEAFNMVVYEMLLRNIAFYCIRGSLLRWFTLYRTAATNTTLTDIILKLFQ